NHTICRAIKFICTLLLFRYPIMPQLEINRNKSDRGIFFCALQNRGGSGYAKACKDTGESSYKKNKKLFHQFPFKFLQLLQIYSHFFIIPLTIPSNTLV